MNPDGPGAQAFLSRAYLRDPDKDVNKALEHAMRASDLEPGSLIFFIDIGRALLAADRISEAKKVADTAQKTATNPGDRTAATSFAKEIEEKVNRGADAVAAKPAVPPAASAADTGGPAAASVRAEGKITEVLCGRAPEILLTLTAGDKPLLLHVTDVSKITLRSKDQDTSVTALPCSSWNGQQAAVDYRAMSSGLAQGEIQSISLH